MPKWWNAYTVSTYLFSLIRKTVTRNIQIEHIAPGALRPNPWNSNKVGPEMEQRLRASVAEFGLYKPILVRQLSDGTLEILGGEHRWRVASDMKLPTVPVINLGAMDDRKAKLLGLADNGQYGEDDSAMLAAILKEIGQEEVSLILPYSADDLAGMFAAASIDLDNLGFDDDEPIPDMPAPDAPRKVITHELMRFKVPVEDRERVEKLIQTVIKTRGLQPEQDSLVAAGMALVEVCNAAKEQF